MKITILHNKTCNIWRTTKRTIKDILKEKKLSAPIEEIVIASDKMAKTYHFAGSPQVLINGKDIDHMAAQITNYHESGCRFYIWKNNLHEGPPKEMLEDAILKKK